MVEDLWGDTVDMAVDGTKAVGADMAVDLTKVVGVAIREKDGEVKVRGMEKAEKVTSHLKV